MENRNKYLLILTLSSLALFGSATFNSYGQNEGIDKGKEQKKEKGEFYGSATAEVAHNIGLQYPAKTDFTPSLVIVKALDKAETDIFAFDATAKIGFKKQFTLEEKLSMVKAELKASEKEAMLSLLYFQYANWSVGLKENNFCTISASPGSAKAIQIAWEKGFEPFNIGLSIEKGKKFELYWDEEVRKKAPLKPKKDLPAASGRFQYDLPAWGNIEFSGLVRPMGWYDTKSKKELVHLGYGINLGTEIILEEKVNKLTTNVLFGSGIGSYLADLGELEKEDNSLYVEGTTVKSIDSFGAYVSFEHRFHPEFRLTVSGGLSNTIGGNEKTRPSAYKRGIYGTGNLTYWLTKKISTGFEYSIGWRTNLDGNTAAANHLKGLVKFEF